MGDVHVTIAAVDMNTPAEADRVFRIQSACAAAVIAITESEFPWLFTHAL